MLFRKWRLGRLARAVSVAFALSLLFGPQCVDAAPAQSASAQPLAKPTPNAVHAAQDVLVGFLDGVLDWYRTSKLPPEAPLDPALKLLLASTPETALAIVKTAFEYARAYAKLLQESANAQSLAEGQPGKPAPANKTPPQNASTMQQRFAQRRAQLESEAQDLSAKIDSLKLELAAAPEGQRAPLQAQLAGLQNQLRLDRVRLDFFAQVERFEQGDTPVSGKGLGLVQKINEMEASVPELTLHQKPFALSDDARAVVSVQYPLAGTGIWGRAKLLFAFQEEQQRVSQLAETTARVGREFDRLPGAMRLKARTLVKQMHHLAAEDVADSDPSVTEQRSQQFDLQLAQLRSIAAVLAPVEAGRSLLRSYQATLADYQSRIRRASDAAMRDLLQQVLALFVVFGFIFGGSAVWRQLALKYVSDPRRFHQLMVFRTITVVLVSALVLMFKFATDMAALVTVMGFAAAGIAFALQNVILSVVGYFSIIGRNGIRVGDRVGLQGPFGYVYGEIFELGMLRITLRELSGGPDNWAPTGRTVVFPNSVVFTGSFLRLPRVGPSTHKPV